MAEELLKSRHAFGSEKDVDSAIAEGKVDAYDILFLSEGKIGWIDKDGNKIILEGKQQVITVDELPEIGESEVVYIYDSKFYFWNGSEFVTSASDSGLDESTVDSKIEIAKEEMTNAARAYTDEQIAAAVAVEVVEF